MKIFGRILEIILTIFLISIIIVNFTLIIKGSIDKEQIPSFFGYKPFIIVSESMRPTIKINDLIITKKIEQDKIQEGDILSYASKDNIIITHRVIDILEENNGKQYVFKGDNNNVKDLENVEYSNIQGKYLCSIPIIGSIALYVQTPIGLAFSIMIIIVIYFTIETSKKMIEEKLKSKNIREEK